MSRSVTARIKPVSSARIDSGIVSVAGVRPQNEDRVDLYQGSNELIGLLADGMGGGDIGATMSDQAVRVARESLRDSPHDEPRLRLERAFRLANQALCNLMQVSSRYRESGSTLIGMLLQTGPSGAIAHIGKLGDSRAYVLTAHGGLRQIGRDHTHGEEWRSAGEGVQAPGAEELTYALGSELQIEQVPDFYHAVPLQEGDTLLLCSDGLSSFVSEDELVALVTRSSAQQAAERLVRRALRNGSDDNVSAIVIRYRPRSPAARPWIVPTALIGLALLLLITGAFMFWGDAVFGQGGGAPVNPVAPVATITSDALPVVSPESFPPTVTFAPTSTRVATATPSSTHTATPTSTQRTTPGVRPTRVPQPPPSATLSQPLPVVPPPTGAPPPPTEVPPPSPTGVPPSPTEVPPPPPPKEAPPMPPTGVPPSPTGVPPPSPTGVPPSPTEVPPLTPTETP
ncbi:MAG: protein phosphatase 2C domain-containing protein [Roseiflexaceae bacterium]|nr:protein phosphatase 2C domain-containing protein [Roseiflexaceae bacterium]